MNSKAKNVAIGSIIMTMLSIGSYNSLAVYVLPLVESLKVGVGQVSLVFAFIGIGSLTSALLLGPILKVAKIRLLVPLAGVSLALFFMIISLARSMVPIYIGAVFFGFSTIMSGYAAAQTEITWWFIKGRGKIISYLSMGAGAFGLFLVPVIAKLIVAHGFRTAAILQGMTAGAVIILVGLLLLSEHPENYGLQPVGFSETDAGQTTAAGTHTDRALSLKQIMGKPSLWLIVTAQFIMVVALTGFSNNASAFYQSIGFSAMTAAWCLSIFNGSHLAWAPFYGVLVDKRGPGFATAVCGLMGAGMFVLAIFIANLTGAIVFAAFAGSIIFVTMLGSICLTKVFGAKEAGSLVGFANAAGSLGAMIGAPIAGFLFDATRSYQTFFIVSAIFLAAGVLMVQISLNCGKTLKK